MAFEESHAQLSQQCVKVTNNTHSFISITDVTDGVL